MSIFKSTLSPTTAAQLKAREQVVVNKTRDDLFLRFTSGKNSWVRMTSLVNSNFNCKRVKDKDGKVILDNDKKPKQICAYYGDQLSRKYVLEGGTLYQSNENSFLLRRGIAQQGGVYGSDLDRVSSSDKAKSSRDLGLRPMPGITNVSIANKSAYGSLREATIEYLIWDRHQLEEMEVLFMRPGYSVFLEWGWSQYLDHDIASNINTVPDNITIKNFDALTINPFANNQTEDDYYKSIDSTIEKTKGNYDAMIGLIKNFSWQLTNEGGYRCTTVLISRGEVLETLKASSNPNIIIDSFSSPSQINPGIGNNEPALVLSLFEKIFLTIKGGINLSEVAKEDGEIYQQLTPPPPTGSSDSSDSSNPPQQQLTQEQIISLKKSIDTTSKEIKKGYDIIIEGLTDPNIKYKWDYKSGIIESSLTFPSEYENLLGLVKVTEASTEGTGIEYISFINFIAILNRFFIPRDKNHKPILQIILPVETPCLMSEDSVSIDPLTCLICNKSATFITDTENVTDSDNIGFNPTLIGSLGYNIDKAHYTYNGLYKLPNFNGNEDNEKNKNIGLIGNIYISISKIISIYRGLMSENGVDITELLTTLLSDISFALGGINDFKLYTDRNIVQIIDAKYLEEGETIKDKYQFTLFGLDSICRNIQLNSRVFAEQSTMISVAAGSSENFNNLGDIYSSTQQYFNRGLSDRIIKDLDIKNEVPGLSPLKDKDGNPVNLYYYHIYQNLASLSNYLNRKVLGLYSKKYIIDNNQYISDMTGNGLRETQIPQEEEVANASSLLKSFHYQLNGGDIDYKSLIPFELEITIDGMGGFIVGQIFTINKRFPSIIPKSYFNNNLGFIILGISHSLQNNDWTTTLRTQICILDNPDDKKSDHYPLPVDKTKLKSIIKQVRKSVITTSYLISAMADYMVYLTLKLTVADNPVTPEYRYPAAKQPFLAGNTFVDNPKTNYKYQFDYLDWDKGGGVNKQALVYGILSGIAYNPQLTKDYSNNLWGGVKNFSATQENKNNYLYMWWNDNKDKGYTSFPSGSFKELLTTPTIDGASTIDFSPLVNTFKQYLFPNYQNYDTDKSRFTDNLNNQLKESIFFYKILGNDPKKTLESEFTANYNFGGDSDTDSAVNLNALFNTYYINVYQAISNGDELGQLIRPDNIISSETDLKATSQSKGRYTLYRAK